MKNDFLLTGGHAATTAIAVIKEIKEKFPDANLFWVGPKSAVEGKYVPTLASTEMPKLNVKFIPIITGRLQRKFTFWTIPSLFKIPIGILQAIQIIKKTKPEIVVSFGGYASVPVCFVAWIFRIPVIINEQTVVTGMANKITAFFASKILIAREESRKYFPSNKTILIGLPVSKGIINTKEKTRIGNTPVIYITGGSSGAQRINKVVGESLYELLKKYKVIHLTGKLDFEEFKAKQNEFPTDLKKNYEVYDFIDPEEVPSFFEKADVIISRAGANTLSEIMVAKRPAILIPIPWTAYDEQLMNARMVEKTGIAKVLEEKDLTSESLLSEIELIIKNWKEMVKKSDSSLAELDRNASKRFVEEMESSLLKA